MRVLLDHCVSKRFRQLLSGHEVRTAYEMGWSEFKNGRLLTAAKDMFDVVVTVDQNLRYQQNLLTLPLAVIILVAPNNRFETLQPYGPITQATLERVTRPVLVVIQATGEIETFYPWTPGRERT